VVEWGGLQDTFYGGEELCVLGKRQATHEDRSGKDFLVGGFGGELGKQIHRLNILAKKRIESE
jgi:hypothetical protein